MRAAKEIKRLQEKIESGEMHPDEPVFTLRAQDRLASEVVRFWAIEAENAGCPELKLTDAVALAVQMDDWPVKQTPGLPDTRVDSSKKCDGER